MVESPCVLVVWSPLSERSDWVKKEADVARKKGTLVPLFLDTLVLPLGFLRINAVDLSDRNNNNAYQGFQLLIDAIESKISPSTLPVTESLPKHGLALLEGAAQTAPQRKPAQQSVGNVGFAQKNQLAIGVAVVMLVILGAVGSMRLWSKVENKSVSGAAAVKVNQEDDARRKTTEAKLSADKETAPPFGAEAKKKLKIGDEYGGGKIAWLDATGQHGLIAAKADIPGPYHSWDAAKAKCASLGDGWRLPTKGELDKLYRAKCAVCGFSDYFYWSSTEYNADNAWIQYFYQGIQGYYDKSFQRCARAVRTF